jgi:hypothetical protein
VHIILIIMDSHTFIVWVLVTFSGSVDILSIRKDTDELLRIQWNTECSK